MTTREPKTMIDFQLKVLKKTVTRNQSDLSPLLTRVNLITFSHNET